MGEIRVGTDLTPQLMRFRVSSHRRSPQVTFCKGVLWFFSLCGIRIPSNLTRRLQVQMAPLDLIVSLGTGYYDSLFAHHWTKVLCPVKSAVSPETVNSYSWLRENQGVPDSPDTLVLSAAASHVRELSARTSGLPNIAIDAMLHVEVADLGELGRVLRQAPWSETPWAT
jgi:hypothetical protein